MNEKTCHINGLNISYLDNEESAPLWLFVHGNSSSKESFLPLIKNLASKNNKRFVALDLPGHGESDHSDYYGPSLFREVLFEFLNHLEIAPEKYIGHSFGGHFGIQLLSHFPEMNLCLLATPALGPKLMEQVVPYSQSQATETFSLISPSKNELQEKWTLLSSKTDHFMSFLEAFNKSDPKFRQTFFPNMLEEGVYDEVAEIKDHDNIVTLFVGELDQVVNMDYIQLLKKALGSKLELKMIPGAGHFLQLDSSLSII